MKTNKQIYEQIIEQMPVGLERGIMRILSDHIGKENSITKAEIIKTLRYQGIKVSDERQVRKSVSLLRKQGILIGSDTTGYFMCRDRQEWIYVRDNQLLQAVRDISDTIRILDKAASDKWGDAHQASLL